MYNEQSPSLFLPKLAAVLLLAIIVSGMAEIVALATTAEKSHYSITSETSKLISKPGKAQAPSTQLTHQVEVN